VAAVQHLGRDQLERGSRTALVGRGCRTGHLPSACSTPWMQRTLLQRLSSGQALYLALHHGSLHLQQSGTPNGLEYMNDS
jgi:hypothetical protein